MKLNLMQSLSLIGNSVVLGWIITIGTWWLLPLTVLAILGSTAGHLVNRREAYLKGQLAAHKRTMLNMSRGES